MALKDEQCNTKSEARFNLITNRKYHKQRFARMRENWTITCIPDDACGGNATTRTRNRNRTHDETRKFPNSAIYKIRCAEK